MIIKQPMCHDPENNPFVETAQYLNNGFMKALWDMSALGKDIDVCYVFLGDQIVFMPKDVLNDCGLINGGVAQDHKQIASSSIDWIYQNRATNKQIIESADESEGILKSINDGVIDDMENDNGS